LQTWALVFVGLVGVLIAYLQWITAHQKIVLELFDKRFEAFQNVSRSLSPLIVHGSISQNEYFEYVRAMERCQFLFGKEIYDYLSSLKKDMSFLVAFTDEAIDASPGRAKLIDKKYEIFERIANFDKVAIPKFMPYMRLDQKMKYFWSIDSMRQILDQKIKHFLIKRSEAKKKDN
jgi:hypothetical protein